MAEHETLFFDQRFCGPPGAVNGGFACGTVAGLLGGTAEVTLRRPVPPERALTVRLGDDGGLTVLDGGTALAEGRPVTADAEPAVPAVPLDVARAVAGRARYYGDPAFPRCFVCGTDRLPGDGLRIFPGPVPGRPVWAAPWTPDLSIAAAGGAVRPEVVWAALDCPSGIAAGEAAGLREDTTALLGRMTVSLCVAPRPGDACLVVAWPIARDGRKLTAGSALLGADGDVLSTARSVWLTVPRAAHLHAAGAAS